MAPGCSTALPQTEPGRLCGWTVAALVSDMEAPSGSVTNSQLVLNRSTL